MSVYQISIVFWFVTGVIWFGLALLLSLISLFSEKDSRSIVIQRLQLFAIASGIFAIASLAFR